MSNIYLVGITHDIYSLKYLYNSSNFKHLVTFVTNKTNATKQANLWLKQCKLNNYKIINEKFKDSDILYGYLIINRILINKL